MEKEKAAERKVRICVTGAGGYNASWLVKLLLSKGYMVHGTVRDPSDKRNSHLKKLDKAIEYLHIFEADLLDYNSIAAAVAGCEGVFHVASPVILSEVTNPEVELLAPAVTGTLNVLKTCSEAKVKRVVLVSSAGAVALNPNWPKDREMNEDCWSDIEYLRATENWYCLSKTLAEGDALDFAKKHGLDVITLCPGMVIGPLLQSALNGSSLFLLELFKGLESVENKIWPYVDVRDLADALLLVYQNAEAFGRYICAPHAVSIHDMVDILKRNYPNYDYPKEFIEVGDSTAGHIGSMSSEKLKHLGWKCRTLEESVIDMWNIIKSLGY